VHVCILYIWKRNSSQLDYFEATYFLVDVPTLLLFAVSVQ